MAEDKKQIQQQILLQQIELLLDEPSNEALPQLLREQHSSDLAEIIDLVDSEERYILFRALDRPMAAEVLEKVNEATRDDVFEVLEDAELNTLFSELDPDDAADLLAELPEHQAQQVLNSLNTQDSDEIRELMRYSEDSAGGIMDPGVIAVPIHASVAEAVEQIRAAEIDEDFYYVFVVDGDGRFVGYVRLRLLLTRPAGSPISALVERDAISVHTDTDQEEVRNVFSKYDLIVVPVLDHQNRLVGRITADRVIEVAEEEAQEDLYTMAGTDPDELDSFSAFNAARIRLTWIVPCLLGTVVTYVVMRFFAAKSGAIFLYAAAFVPMVAAISGNTGMQTSAIVMSGLATGHLAALRFGQVFAREVRIALIVAIACGLLGALACWIFSHFYASNQSIKLYHQIFALGLGMFSAIMVSTTLGLLLPFLFRSIGIDPAISSGPIITTANDSISVAIYLSLAIFLSR